MGEFAVHFISETKAIVYRKGSYSEYHVEYFNEGIERYQLVELKLDEKIILKFKDTLNDKTDLSTFTRTIIKNIDIKHEYIYNEGELLIKKTIKKVEFLTKINKNMSQSKKIITMDLETRTINEVMTIYCVSIYDGKTTKSFYLSDYINNVTDVTDVTNTDNLDNLDNTLNTGNGVVANAEKAMLTASILYLMKRKYHNHRIFLHNFSRFDAVFLLRIMSNLSDQIKPIMRNGKILDLRLKFANNYNLFFRDSLLLLPAPLRSLAKNFNVEEKGIFPYKFVNNPDISLDYNGLVPSFNNFDGITLEAYQEYCKEFNVENKGSASCWNLKT